MDKSGWKKIHFYVKNTNKMNRFLKVAKAKHIRNTANLKFGIKIPCDHKGAMMFDTKSGNNNWKDDDLLELKQIYNFDPINYLGPFNIACILPGHTNIQVHLIYD